MFKLRSNEKPSSIRVFISSTFVDMQREREQLIKHTFPLLRKEARARGVELTEIDLRWGISKEDTKKGETITRCLSEIERSRPYFIGLLGHRYGWIPVELLPGEDEETRVARVDLLRRKLKREDTQRGAIALVDEGMSATEIEIQHGVLRSPDARNRARFYYRAVSDVAFSEPSGSSAEARLDALKAAIESRMQANPPTVFADTTALHEAVLRDFQGFLDDEYPLKDKPSELHSTMRAHKEFAQSRLGVWEGAEDLLDELDSLVDGGAPQVLVSGVAGLGKSALLAHWIDRRQEFDEMVFYAFCGGGPRTARWADLMRLLIEQVADYYEIPEEAATVKDDSQLAPRFLEVLAHGIAKDGEIVLVIDGLDQVTDAGDMRWWPHNFPKGIRTVLGVRQGTVADLLLGRGLPAITMRPLGMADRNSIIRKVLKHFAKDLGKELQQEIAEDKESGNPLVLRTLLEELKSHGDHGSLDTVVHGYIDTDSPGSFFFKVIERIDRDYASARKVLPFLAVAVTGLSEPEIRQVSGLADHHLAWAELHDVLAPHLVERNGLLVFGHDYILQAVNGFYLHTNEALVSAQNALADYFLSENRRMDDHALREWPELLARAGESDRLKSELSKADAAEALAKREPADLRRWWMATGCNGDKIEEILVCTLVNVPLGDRPCAIETFVKRWVGRYRLLVTRAEARLQELDVRLGAKHPNTIDTKGDLATLYSYLGMCQEALTLRKEVFESCPHIHGTDHPDAIRSTGNLALSYSDLGMDREALALNEDVFERRLRINGSDHPFTTTAKHNLAISYSNLGMHQEALKLELEVLESRQRILGPDHPDTIRAKASLACSYYDLGMHQKALTLREEVVESCQRILGIDHPATIRANGNLAKSYSATGRDREGLALNEAALESYQRILGDNHSDTITVKGNLASSYSDLGMNQEALKLEMEVLESRQRILGPNHRDTTTAKQNLAVSYSALGMHQAALKLEMEVLESRQRILGSDHRDTITAKQNLALSYSALGMHQEALTLELDVLESSQRILGFDHPSTISAKASLARSYYDLGIYQRALTLRAEVVESRQRIFGIDHIDTIRAKERLALSFSDFGMHQEALTLREEVFELHQRILGDDHPDTLRAKELLSAESAALAGDQKA